MGDFEKKILASACRKKKIACSTNAIESLREKKGKKYPAHQGPVARSLVSANRWLRGIKMYRFPWYLTLVSTNHASSNPGQIARKKILDDQKSPTPPPQELNGRP